MENKQYLEIIELFEDEAPGLNFIKVEVANKKEAEIKIANLEKEFIGKKYIARYHICGHNKNGKNQPCKIEILKEVKKIK